MSKDLHSRIERGLSSLSDRIKGLTGAGLNDAAKFLEPFAARLLNAAYGWNLTDPAPGVPTTKAIDLTDDAAAVAVQVSVQESAEKIKHTAKMAADGSLARYRTIAVFFLHYVKHRNDHGLRIINIPTLLADLMGKDLPVLEKVADIVEREVSGSGQTIHEQQAENLSVTRATFDAVQELVAKFGTAGPGAVPSPIATSTPQQRVAYYLACCVYAFRAYEELGTDNFRHADDKAPDIWDIFVPPGCAQKPITPEEMEAAQSAEPPQNPARDLLPLLADEKVRRHVLLGDPGMGKSTLIQRLIAGLADGRPTPGAEALQNSLPIPFILRDLVPLMPPDVSTWNWDTLCRTLHAEYKRNDQAQPLCLAWATYREFRAELLTHPRAFFLLDGLDEIGDLTKRTAIRDAIWEGFRAHPEARWVITSRIVGYGTSPLDGMEWFEPMVLDEDGTLIEPHPTEVPARAWSSYGTAILNSQHHGWASGFDGKPRHYMESVHVLEFAKIHYLSPFDNQKQEAFTQNWFRARNPNNPSPSLLLEIRQRGHDGIRVIARVPNLLCYMAMLKRSGKPLPDGRAVLYTEIVRAYLHGIDRAYHLSQKDHGHACPFRVEDTWHLLSLLAAEMQRQRTGNAARPGGPTAQVSTTSAAGTDGAPSDGNITIPESEVHALLIPAIQRLQPNADTPALLREFLSHIARRSGLLLPRGTGAGGTLYGFSHLSFLEYFAACYLNDQLAEADSRLIAATRSTFDRDKWHLEHPPGPLAVTPASLEQWAAQPLWAETLFFLAELRAENSDTLDLLLQDLFPALHGSRKHEPVPVIQGYGNKNAAMLSLQAVTLAIRIARDHHLLIPTETTHQWYVRLWNAYLSWQTWDPYTHAWPIAPVLLDTQTYIPAALRACEEALRRHPTLERLELRRCPNLTRIPNLPFGLKSLNLAGCSALVALPELPASLRGLELQRCSSLTTLPTLPTSLSFLNLSECSGMMELPALPESLECLFLANWEELRSLPSLPFSLKQLHLEGCSTLAALPALPTSLQQLDLTGCTGLRTLPPLPETLTGLWCEYCTGLEADDVKRVDAWARSKDPPCSFRPPHG